MRKENEVVEDAVFEEMDSGRREELVPETFPNGPIVDTLEEDKTLSVVVDQAEKKVTARYQGKVLVERNPGDWFIPNSFQVNNAGLKKAWLTKFKESLPDDVRISFSFNGGFSMGQRGNPSTVGGIKTLMEQRLTGKKVGPGKRKKKRK